SDGGRARAVLAVVQLLAGIILLSLGWHGAGVVTNVFVFLGLSLALMSVAALISEGRHARSVRVRAPWILGATAMLFTLSLAMDAGLAFALVVAAGVLLGEI